MRREVRTGTTIVVTDMEARRPARAESDSLRALRREDVEHGAWTATDFEKRSLRRDSRKRRADLVV